MTNNITFHKGQKVRRVKPSIDNVVEGEVYTVSRYMDGHVTLEGVSGALWYRASYFEAVPAKPDMASVPMFVEGEGSVLMANVDEETGQVQQVIMAMPGLINLERPDEMVGYCIYDSIGYYKQGFTESYWARELFKPISAATITFQLPK